ncbi:hypothetical protein [Nocardiopsis sp. FR4]|uniref:hypothetical protein n=1 Tax=Nocardiopsis sp. FR4 TaxID=2605985 RepID=UPI001357D6C6|nr:hypothetical protein [Nocardiopsis sp. FR4]
MPRTVALFSLGGAPGVTSAATALAAVWPGEPGAVLVEADASGGDLAAWRRLHPEPGLTGLAAASRHGGVPEPGAHTQTLPGGLAVCPAPVTAGTAEGAVRLLSRNPAVLAWDQVPAVVLDLGRLTPGSAATALAAHADAVFLVVPDALAQLRRAREAAPDLAAALPGLRVLVAGGRGGVGEIADALGLPVWGRLPEDRRSAAFLRGETHLGRPYRRPLFRAVARLAGDLAAPVAAAPAPAVPAPAHQPTGAPA